MQRRNQRQNAIALALIFHQITLEVAPALSPIMAEANVSQKQVDLLRYVASQRDGVTMTEAARRLSHSTAAATGTADRLEKLGLVERIHAADDRRKVLLRATDGGTMLLRRLDEATVSRIDERFGRHIDASRALQQFLSVLSANVPGA